MSLSNNLCVRDAGVEGSNPFTPTNVFQRVNNVSGCFFLPLLAHNWRTIRIFRKWDNIKNSYWFSPDRALSNITHHKPRLPGKQISAKKDAHRIVQTSLRNGVIYKPSHCQDCRSGKRLDAHHDNYDNPLDIRWLCRSCHLKWHAKNLALGDVE